MRVLAIETVETTGSVALLDGERLAAECRLDAHMRSAQSLAPGIDRLLESAGWRAADVQLVAVASGPGSFTGLRIGVTTAKVFAYATGCHLIGVNTMAAIAARVPGDVPQFSVVVDAHRNELFVADFIRRAGQLEECRSTRIESADRWISQLAADAVVSGPGLAKHASRLGERAVMVDTSLWQPTAESVGRIGWRDFAAGRGTSPFELVPEYYRRTAAEEKADAANQLEQ